MLQAPTLLPFVRQVWAVCFNGPQEDRIGTACGKGMPAAGIRLNQSGVLPVCRTVVSIVAAKVKVLI